jgi:hypothetical protein
MKAKAGVNWVIAVFAQQCVLAVVLLGRFETASVAGLLAVIGLFFAIGAWRRQFWGFAGVIAMCGLAVLLDLYLLLVVGSDPMLLLHTLVHVAIAGALFSARRRFPRAPAPR